MTSLLLLLLAQSPVTDYVGKNCVGCHQGQRAPFGLDFTKLDLDFADREKASRWVRIHDAVANGSMPPGGKGDRQPFLKALGAEIRSFEQQRFAARGRTVMRRLNRYEYENTLRDLLGAPWLSLRDSLPEDGIAHRFNKSGTALDVSHIQMARYLDTAEQALREVLATQAAPANVRRYHAREQQRMIRRMFYGPFNNHPERAFIPVLGFDAQPDVLHAKAPVSNPAQKELEGFATPAGTYNGNDYSWDQFQANAGGRYKLRLHTYSLWLHTVWGPLNNKNRPPHWRPQREKTERGRTVEPLSLYALRPGGEKRYLTTIDVGPEPQVHEVTVDLLPGDSISPDAARLFRSRPGFVGSPHASEAGMPGLVYRWMEVEGPLPAAIPALIPPDRASAPEYLRRFIARTLRRPLRESEYQAASRIFEASKGSLKEAMIESYVAVLCSPAFLYLEETPGPLDDWALASRLAYFLTNTAPDGELRRLATEGRLREPRVLAGEAERLLKSSRLRQFTDAFLDYWLDLRKLNDNTPDQVLYPEYYLDDLLTESAEAQTRRFFAHLVEQNRPVAELASSNYTFVNEHLARHYGLPPVAGSAMQRVALPAESPRGGLLTHASVLKITANGTTTSPVLRGAWIMERIYGMPPPPPPPGVSAVEPDTRGATTIREQLAKHRADAGCAACHRKIDPPGFALERFDVLGGERKQYRSTEEGEPVAGLGKNGHAFTFRLGKTVDASGDFFGKPFRDVREFQDILAKDERQLARNLLNQLLVYATGEPASFSERATLEAMLDRAAAERYGVRSLIRELVLSPLFSHK